MFEIVLLCVCFPSEMHLSVAFKMTRYFVTVYAIYMYFNIVLNYIMKSRKRLRFQGEYGGGGNRRGSGEINQTTSGVKPQTKRFIRNGSRVMPGKQLGFATCPNLSLPLLSQRVGRLGEGDVG